VLTRVLGDQSSGRLYKALVESKLAASVKAFSYQFREPAMLFAEAQLRAGGPVDSARTALEHTLDAAATTPVTDEEVTRAKTALLKNIELELTNSERVGFDLTEWAALGDWRLMFLHRDRLEKVTPADVHRVAAAYLKPSNRTAGVFLPTDKPDRAVIPQVASVEQMVANYSGRAVVQAGEAFEASPANIDARTSHVALANGMQLTLLPKKTRGGTVNAQLVVRYGDVNSLVNKTAIAGLTAAMLSRGTTALARQQVRDSLDKLKASVNLVGGGNNVAITVETTGDKLPAVLALVASELRTPRFDSTEFEKLKQEQLATLEQQKSEPQTKAFIGIQQRMAPYPRGHPLRVSSSEEEIADISTATIDQVRQFHRDFYGASSADLSVVGDVNADSITAAARTLFGGWRSPRPLPGSCARLRPSTPRRSSSRHRTRPTRCSPRPRTSRSVTTIRTTRRWRSPTSCWAADS
jgi:zinc protease